MNPEELLRLAQDAIARGADPAVVVARYQQMTGQSFPASSAPGRMGGAGPVADTGGRGGGPPATTGAGRPQDLARAFAAAGLEGPGMGELARLTANSALFGLPGRAGLLDREAIERTREAYPGASTAAEILGGVALPAAGGAKLASKLVRPGAGLLSRAFGTGLAGAAAGAGAGALQGIGSGEASTLGGLLGEAGRGAGMGAAAGGLLGAALPVAGGAGGEIYRTARGLVAPESSARLGAGRQLRRGLERANIPESDIANRLGLLGPEAVVADIDPALGILARGAVNQAPALQRAGGPISQIAARQSEQGDRLARMLRETSGITDLRGPAKQMAEQALQQVREQAYRPIENLPAQGNTITQAMNNLLVKSAAKGLPKNRVPTVREMQDVMLDLRDEATAARAAGRPNRAAKANAAYRQLYGAMKKDIPGFADAQNAFRPAAQTAQAFDRGYKAATKPAEQIGEMFGALPPEAHDAFRIGMVQKIEEDLLKREGGGAAAGAIINAGKETEAKLRVLFRDPQGFAAFLEGKNLEDAFRRTYRAVTGNSSTATQLSEMLQQMPQSPAQLKSRVFEALFNLNPVRERQAELLGQSLLGRDPDAIQELLRQNPFGRGLLYTGRGAAGAGGAIPGLLGWQQ